MRLHKGSRTRLDLKWILDQKSSRSSRVLACSIWRSADWRDSSSQSRTFAFFSPFPKVKEASLLNFALDLDALAPHRCRGPNWPSVGSAQQNHGSVSLGGRFLCLDGAGETKAGIRLP